MTRKTLLSALFGTGMLAALFLPVLPARAIEATPVALTTQTPDTQAATNVIKNFYAELTDSMRRADTLGYAGRYKKMQTAVHTAFDMPTMTRLATGLAWTNATPDEQTQLISAFESFSAASYASQFNAYDGEQFALGDTKPMNGGLMVETTLQPKEGDAVALNYMMRRDAAGSWRIVDVFLNGTISQLATRRAEFSAIAHKDGIAALVNSLGEKSKQMGPS
ncbi:MAG: ABC transporter substrate-binding protein [Alphaproteobacteria bacterium]|nr:ABC transporter substrate-binding protein [Alphaproteobacteria bacterium]MBV8548832.1 ABC transporter substrate-binding protein [Alphaproteobacteria bacterium]